MKRSGLPMVTLVALAALSAPGQSEEPKSVDQRALRALAIEDRAEAFETAFQAGDELTEASFTTARGVGAHVGNGIRFTRTPRADLTGENEWSNHVPSREAGPNATSCVSCHNKPIENGAGDVATNVILDPLHTGDPAKYLERNTLHLFALGAPQRLAEEITSELHKQQNDLMARLCRSGGNGETRLTAKSIDFGVIAASASRPGHECEISFDYSQIKGIDEDLIVKPFGWKGNFATIRGFTRNAAHNELGMQAVELVGTEDGDGDGVANEMTVGDLTALTIYMAALERPSNKIELADLRLIELSQDDYLAIKRGESLFGDAACGSCHVPELRMEDPVFREPSALPEYRENLPAGMSAEDVGLDPEHPVRFNLTTDQPNNRIRTETVDIRLGSFNRTAEGAGIVRWYSDFKRHDMGPDLADPVDALGYGPSVWLTRSLAGVGSTGPWLHNGHATTLAEAIEAHGGEASDSRDRYRSLSESERADLIAFLESLVIYKHAGEEEND